MVDLKRTLLPVFLLSSSARSFSTRRPASPPFDITRSSSAAPSRSSVTITALRARQSDDERSPEDKFSFGQRIESAKSAVIGLLAGGIAATPFTALHDIPLFGAAQWEFDT